jgi:hypothetical protein
MRAAKTGIACFSGAAGRWCHPFRLNQYNHLSEVLAFNTPDEHLGREILDFINRGR